QYDVTCSSKQLKVAVFVNNSESIVYLEKLKGYPVQYDVTCSSKQLKVAVFVNNSESIVYLEKLKGYPGCQPELSPGKALFRLPLDNIYTCGTTRMHNKITGQRIFYHRVMIETPGEETEVILAKCVLPGGFNQTSTSGSRSRRQSLPFDLIEPEHLNITEYIEARAPVPYLDVAIRQNGRVLDTTLNVQPGTPLEMLVFLDPKSRGIRSRSRCHVRAGSDLIFPGGLCKTAGRSGTKGTGASPPAAIGQRRGADQSQPAVMSRSLCHANLHTPLNDTYGILTSYLKVTDSSSNQEEIIVMNGCSIDPYIFGNFETLDGGDTLSAKFRAFKFPESNYVLFVGTVNICIKECKGVPCGNDQYGYGRRKRAIPPQLPNDPNKVFEVELTTFLKVEYRDELFTLKKGSISGEFDTRHANQLPLKQAATIDGDPSFLLETSAAPNLQAQMSSVLLVVAMAYGDSANRHMPSSTWSRDRQLICRLAREAFGRVPFEVPVGQESTSI
ncbi:hypothetical protein HPB47_021845, partial [Ixodes persulcatus]